MEVNLPDATKTFASKKSLNYDNTDITDNPNVTQLYRSRQMTDDGPQSLTINYAIDEYPRLTYCKVSPLTTPLTNKEDEQNEKSDGKL